MAMRSSTGFEPNEALQQIRCEGAAPNLQSSQGNDHLKPQSLARRQQIFERVGTSFVFLCFAVLVLAFGIVIALKDHRDVQDSTWRTLQNITVKVFYDFSFRCT